MVTNYGISFIVAFYFLFIALITMEKHCYHMLLGTF
jgi:hypothetical protein